MTMPPAALTSRRPSVPSVPVPDRMMQIARCCWSSASERKKKSMGTRTPRCLIGSVRCSFSPLIVKYVLGGMT